MLWSILWTLVRVSHPNFEPYPYPTRVLGLNYLDYNRLATIPILLLLPPLLALHLLHRPSDGRRGWRGFVLSLIGFSMLLLGQVLGFVVGTRENFGAWHVQAGWFIFFSGFFVLAAGLVIFGSAVRRLRILPGLRRHLPLVLGLIPWTTPILQLLSQEAFTAIFAAFGVVWAWLSSALWWEAASTQAKPSLP